MEHLNAVRGGYQSNALSKHSQLDHRNVNVEFRSKVLRGGIKYNLDIFILEAHMIHKYSQDNSINLLNQRGEWGHRGLPRLQVTT